MNLAEKVLAIYIWTDSLRARPIMPVAQSSPPRRAFLGVPVASILPSPFFAIRPGPSPIIDAWAGHGDNRNDHSLGPGLEGPLNQNLVSLNLFDFWQERPWNFCNFKGNISGV